MICAELLERLRKDEIIEPITRETVLRNMNRKNEWQEMLGRYIGKYFRCWWI